MTEKQYIYDLFDSLDPNQKAAFMHANLAWARNIDLVNELEKRILWKDKA